MIYGFGITRRIVFMRRRHSDTVLSTFEDVDSFLSERTKYIDTRILQLKVDCGLANDPHDQNWYNRLIQELEWAKQAVFKKYKKDCALEIWK